MDERLEAANKLVEQGIFEQIPVDPPLWRFTKRGQEENIERIAFASTQMISMISENLEALVKDTREALFRVHNNVPFGLEEIIPEEEDEESRPSQLSFELEQDEPPAPAPREREVPGQYL